MIIPLPSACSATAPCKCCGAMASLFGAVDFEKNCERRPLPASGVRIHYYGCPRCQFFFTTAFDQFTNEDFRRYIYNDEYVLVDPEYAGARPRRDFGVVNRLFWNAKPPTILDYGGGTGKLAELLRTAGYPDVDTYDPFVPQFATRPAHRYHCIVCFEVAEHSTDPAEIFREMNELLVEGGLILFSTLLAPDRIEPHMLDWWYVAPRNGHVSLYGRAALENLVRPYGFTLLSFDNLYHVLFREVPDFAKHFITNG